MRSDVKHTDELRFSLKLHAVCVTVVVICISIQKLTLHFMNLENPEACHSKQTSL